ncbi:MAG: DUF222 domain-containing protein [Actinomycetota bacterium]
MFDSLPGVYRLDVANKRLPAAGLLALLDATDVTAEHVRLLAGLDVDALDPFSQLVALRLWHRVGSWVSAQEQRAIVAVARPRPQSVDDWIVEEIAAVLHLAPSTAGRRVNTARQLTGRLGATGTALAAGAIPYWHAAHLAEQLDGHPDATATTVETQVLPDAGGQTCGQFRRAVAKAIAAADPAALEDRHAEALRGSDVQVWVEPDGMASLLARGPAPAIYELYDRVCWQAASAAISANETRAANAAGATPPVPDGSLIGERRFDAFLRITDPDARAQNPDTGRPSEISDPSSASTAAGPPRCGPPGARRQVGILMDLPTALGLADQPGEIPGYGPVPAATARQYAADADWQVWLVDAATSTLTGLGTQRYRPNRRLRDYIEARDQTCRHPGCARPAWRCDIDHATPHHAGGCTDPANCGCFCRRHHRLKHETDWHITRAPDGTVTWTSPFAQKHTVRPPNYQWMLHPPGEPAPQHDQTAESAIPPAAEAVADDDPPQF